MRVLITFDTELLQIFFNTSDIICNICLCGCLRFYKILVDCMRKMIHGTCSFVPHFMWIQRVTWKQMDGQTPVTATDPCDRYKPP